VRGVLYVAVGNEHLRYALNSIASLRRFYDGPVRLVTTPDCQPPELHLGIELRQVETPGINFHEKSRELKTRLDKHCFDETLFLDADTVIEKPIDPVWDVKDDFAMVLDSHQTNIMFYNEEAILMKGLGLTEGPYFNTGVMLIRDVARLVTLFETWNAEWRRYKQIDQPAFARACKKTGVFPAVMSRRFNFFYFGWFQSPQPWFEKLKVMDDGVIVRHYISEEHKRIIQWVIEDPRCRPPTLAL
jgi:hypothetical protein